MQGIFQKVNGLYDTLKIKNKMILVHFTIVFSVCLVSLIALQTALRFYDDLLYNEAAQVLNLSTANIEAELRKMESLSYNMVSDRNIQEIADSVKKQEGEYNKYYEMDKMMDKLSIYVASERNISSIYYFDTLESHIAGGMNPVSLRDEVKRNIIDQTLEKQGAMVFIDDYADENFVICARQMREIQGLSLESLGTLAIRINVNNLVREYLMNRAMADTELLILSDQEVIYKGDLEEIEEEFYSFDHKNGYVIRNINGNKKFIAYSTSDYSKWTYVNVLPYNSIFKKTVLVRNMMIFVFFIIFLSTSFLSLRIARNITRPIEELTVKMKRVENGDFTIGENNLFKQKRFDEIGTLQKDFEIMIEKINVLINENYKKQIVIKDTQLKALQAQINPHFLYNTLESINWMAKVNHQADISIMVEALGNLLRNTISKKQKVITVKAEIELLEAYITIQKMRYEDRLIFENHIEEKYEGNKIPKLTLQPLVENSIIHGLENMLEACEIIISSRIEDQKLCIIVADNGPGIRGEHLNKKKSGNGLGIGLDNINERLKMVFGNEYGIQIESKVNEGTKVKVYIPIEEEEKYV